MTILVFGGTAGDDNSYAVVESFTPGAGWTWFVMEYDSGEEVVCGLVEGTCMEFGSFSLAEIRDVEGPWGMHAERDRFFSLTRAREQEAYQREWGGRGPYDRMGEVDEGDEGDEGERCVGSGSKSSYS
jgi:hypothetical protein